MQMSDSAAANPPISAHPSVSCSEGDRGSVVTASPPNDHVAPYSAIASAGSSSHLPPTSPSFPSSLPSSTYKAAPSVFGSRVATMAATSPPTTVGPGMGSVDGFGPRSSGLSTATTTMSLNLDLPSRDSQLHVAEARAALMASMSNMLDSELQSRASLLHSNAAALSRQEQDVVKATKALRRENDKLAKVAKDAGRKIKELGNVQNWAEVLERDFLVLEETMRLVRDSSAESDGEGSSSDYSGGYWSQSESERDREVDGDSPGDSIPGSTEKGAGKGKGVENGAPNSHGPIIIKSGSASSNASPVPGPSRSATTVSLDEAVMESLAEAMATDIRIGSRAAGQNTAACRNIP